MLVFDEGKKLEPLRAEYTNINIKSDGGYPLLVYTHSVILVFQAI